MHPMDSTVYFRTHVYESANYNLGQTSKHYASPDNLYKMKHHFQLLKGTGSTGTMQRQEIDLSQFGLAINACKSICSMVLGGIMCALICHPEIFRQGVCECFYTGEVYVHGNLKYLRSAECRLFNVQDISTMLWWEVLVILVASNIVIGFITFFLKRSVLGFCMRTVFFKKNVYFDLRLLKFIFEVLRQH